MKNGPQSTARPIIHVVIQKSFLSCRKRRRNVWHGRSNLSSQFDAEFSEALLAFNGEAVLYCRGISDILAHEYAMDYTRMLQNRAKGLEVSLPRIPHGLFEPNRNLIRSTLERMCEKYFPSR